MNTKYLQAAFVRFIEQQDYMPVTYENGEIPENPNIKVLYKTSFGSQMALELVNGDFFSAEEIRERLELCRTNIENMKGRGAWYYFQVFVFNSTPDPEKLQVIRQGQHKKVLGRKYLSCICVSLSEKKVEKLFTLPAATGGIEKLLKSLLEEDLEKYTAAVDLYELMERKEKENSMDFSSSTSWVTYSLIAVNIAVWALLMIYERISGISYGSLIVSLGAKENTRIIASGEYWRFLTPIFLHGGTVHLLVNSYSLYALGRTVERLYGNIKFIFVYLVAGIIGNIASFMFSSAPAVGASGAIFGLLGALLYYGIENPVLFKRYFGYDVITTIVINISYGFSRSGIDNFAHLGGLVGGFLAAGIVKIKAVNKKYLSRTAFLLATLLITTLGLFYGFTNQQNRALVKLNEMERMKNAENWEEVERIGEEIYGMKLSNHDILLRALWELAVAEDSQGKYEEAIQHAKEIVRLEPLHGHYLLGAVYYDARQYPLAKQELLEAKKIGAPYKEEIDRLLKKLEAVTAP